MHKVYKRQPLAPLELGARVGESLVHNKVELRAPRKASLDPALFDLAQCARHDRSLGQSSRYESAPADG